MFQCILGVEIGESRSGHSFDASVFDFLRLTANSYLFPYVLGESQPILVGPQDATRLVLLVFAALVQSIALVVLREF